MLSVASGGTAVPLPAWVELLMVLLLAIGTPAVVLSYRGMYRDIQHGLRTYALGGRWVAARSRPTDVLWAAPFPLIIAALWFGSWFGPGTPGGDALSRAWTVTFPWLLFAATGYATAYGTLTVVGLVGIRSPSSSGRAPHRPVVAGLAVSAAAIAILVTAVAVASEM